MARKVLMAFIAAGALGFFVGSVINNEMVYSLSGCIAVNAGLVLAIIDRRAERNKAA